MLIERRSPLTGKINTMEINVTFDELRRWREGTLIQVAMPNLTPEEREFIMSGCTAEDWNKIMCTWAVEDEASPLETALRQGQAIVDSLDKEKN